MLRKVRSEVPTCWRNEDDDLDVRSYESLVVKEGPPLLLPRIDNVGECEPDGELDRE